ncbi:MAG: DMT family transporter [Rhodospirillaceae bacterium]|nr:DMT family transporter [Rhodospirillaceae bacterium]MBT3932151.1 DMT family transporter [Rhodospirillaceae bacterium]MBT4773527.1 DMT family transporter [Rhodospirillaceae bacterium]MBT5358031.1 DMT family transporter [Rhodospirillaceae bacterium]MBT5769272.1 DMT family transporter [Rhodospirillaceae bacterium]
MTGTAPATKRLAMLAAIAAVVAPFAAGTTLGAIRFVADDIDPLTITILRLGIGAAVLLPLALVFARGWPRGRDFWIVIGFGVLMFGISQWLVSASLAYTTAARGGILASTVPFMTLAFAVGLRAERLTCLKAVGVGVATLGVAFALWQDASAIPGGWRGDLLMFAASLVLSIYNVATRKVIRRYPPLIFVVCNLLPGALFLGIVGTLTGRVGAASFASVAASENGILAVLYIGIVGSAFTYFLWLWALRHTSPTRVAIGLTMNPVGALVAAAIILDETITLGVWIGLACIAGGILATNWQLQDRSQDKPDGP